MCRWLCGQWFDQGYELGGGQPFTVGTEGDLRNQRHIVSQCRTSDSSGTYRTRSQASATQMLDQLFAGEASPCARGVPYVDCSENMQAPRLSYAPCKDTACLFQTNIQLLPALSARASRAAELAKVAQDNDAALGTPYSPDLAPGCSCLLVRRGSQRALPRVRALKCCGL